MQNVKSFIQKNTFFIVAGVVLISFFSPYDLIYGLNRTVNWQYDNSNYFLFMTFAFGLFFADSIVYLFGYGLFKLLKIKTHFIYSFLNILGLFFLKILAPVLDIYPNIILMNLSIAIWLTFYFNCFKSIKNHISK